LHDAFQNKFDAAILVTGDSDLLEAVRIVTKELKKTVGVLNPQPKPCQVLLKEATFYKQIRAGVVSSCQFPDEIADAIGTFHKPEMWKLPNGKKAV
jgi:hypothetical protein